MRGGEEEGASLIHPGAKGANKGGKSLQSARCQYSFWGGGEKGDVPVSWGGKNRGGRAPPTAENRGGGEPIQGKLSRRGGITQEDGGISCSGRRYFHREGGKEEKVVRFAFDGRGLSIPSGTGEKKKKGEHEKGGPLSSARGCIEGFFWGREEGVKF